MCTSRLLTRTGLLDPKSVFQIKARLNRCELIFALVSSAATLYTVIPWARENKHGLSGLLYWLLVPEAATAMTTVGLYTRRSIDWGGCNTQCEHANLTIEHTNVPLNGWAALPDLQLYQQPCDGVTVRPLPQTKAIACPHEQHGHLASTAILATTSAPTSTLSMTLKSKQVHLQPSRRATG